MICDECKIERCEKCGKPIFPSGGQYPWTFPNYPYTDPNKVWCSGTTNDNGFLGKLMACPYGSDDCKNCI